MLSCYLTLFIFKIQITFQFQFLIMNEAIYYLEYLEYESIFKISGYICLAYSLFIIIYTHKYTNWRKGDLKNQYYKFLYLSVFNNLGII